MQNTKKKPATTELYCGKELFLMPASISLIVNIIDLEILLYKDFVFV